MRLHKTGHAIADTVSDLIGDLPDGRYKIAYGILRHDEFSGLEPWFCVDKGFYEAGHYNGNYRIACRGTQPKYSVLGPKSTHGLDLEPFRYTGSHSLICPPTTHVAQFYGIDETVWLLNAIRQADGKYIIRHKGDSQPIEWDIIRQVITFNSTVGVEALRRGIPVISDPVYSTIGSYTVDIKSIDELNRDELFSFMAGHQFRLHEKDKITWLIHHYLTYSSVGIQEKQ